jgi:hypothetical protein
MLRDFDVFGAEREVPGCRPGQSDQASDGVQVDDVLIGVDRPPDAAHFSGAVGAKASDKPGAIHCRASAVSRKSSLQAGTGA